MSFVTDVRRVLRSLYRAPGFALAVILTLALGIGANTAIFSVVRGTLLRALPNQEGSRLVYFRHSMEGAGQEEIFYSVPEILDFRTSAKSLRAFAEFSPMTFTMMALDEPMHVQVGIVSGNYFAVMGLRPVLGRLFDARDDGPNATPVIVLTRELWQQKFGGDASVIGRSVRINDRPLSVVGVVQSAPQFPNRTDLFVNTVTSAHHMSATMVHGRTHRMTAVFARLAPGATVEDARSEVNRIVSNVHADHPEVYDRASQYRTTIAPLHDVLNERARLTLWLIMGAAAFVLLIACANVANLTLMRGVRREREMLVRTVLGAGTMRLRLLFLTENLVLALIGAGLGLLLAYFGRNMLVAFAQQLTPRANEIRLDGAVLAFTLATALVTAVLLSFAPRLGMEGALAASLKTAGSRTTAGSTRRFLQRALVVTQLAVCVLLLTGAGLLLRTLTKLDNVETGTKVENVLTMELPIESEGITDAAKLTMYERMRDRVAALPDVIEVGLGSNVPLRGADFMLEVKAEGRALAANEPPTQSEYRTASPEYFHAAGIPLLRGRAFTTTDRGAGARFVVLNKTLADRLFPNQDPIGKRVAWTGEVLKFIPVSGDWRTVVGVVGDTRDGGPASAPRPVMFQPFAQEVVFTGSFVIRARADAAAMGPTVRRAIRELYPQQLVENVMTLEEVRDVSVAPRRLNAVVISLFAALAMLIAAVGIAAVLAFSVSARIGEIGIRMSLGATSGRVQRMIIAEGGVLVAAGLVLGLIGSFATTRLMASLLFGVPANDPPTIFAVMALMAAVSVVACWVPAVKAASVDPAVTLRNQ